MRLYIDIISRDSHEKSRIVKLIKKLVLMIINVQVKELPSNKSFDKWYQQWTLGLSRSFPNFKKSEEGSLMIKNNKSKWIIFSSTEGALNVTHISYIINRSNKIFFIQGFTEGALFSEYKDDFEKIAKSFRFE